MGATLRCPLCGEVIDFTAWRASACCQACGRRVRFEDAMAAGAASPEAPAEPAPHEPPAAWAAPSQPPAAWAAPAPGAGVPGPMSAAAVPPVSSSFGAGRPRTFLGKPLVWTKAWALVLVIWVAAAAGLAAVRVDMGHLTVLSARERTAVGEVQRGQVQPGVTNAQALATLQKRYSLPGDRPDWFVQDRDWEHQLYVSWELGKYAPLSWTVGYDGKVTPDAETRLVLKEALRAPTPAPTALPSVPPGL